MPSDTTLVTSYGYSTAGYVQSVTDPRGIVTETTYDMLGQVLQTIDGYSTLINGGLPTTSANATTDYTYNGICAVTVHNSNRVPISGNVSAFGRRYGHQGGRLDPVTGWYDFRNRDYIPSEGRRPERDPMGFGGATQILYMYVYDNLISFPDELGLCPTKVAKSSSSDASNFVWNGTVCLIASKERQNNVGESITWAKEARAYYDNSQGHAEIWGGTGNLNDIEYVLNTIPDGSIITLSIGGHGFEGNVWLGENYLMTESFSSMTLYYSPNLLNLIKKKMSKNGKIEIHACMFGNNIQKLQLLSNLTGKKIIATNGTCESWNDAQFGMTVATPNGGDIDELFNKCYEQSRRDTVQGAFDNTIQKHKQICK